jgi:curved DNA-binding protein CbpA
LAPTHYDILGVRSTATSDEIRRRYKFLVIAFHPDRFVRTPEHHVLAEQRIKQINEAYRVLSDSQARTQYDLQRLATVAGGGITLQPYVAQLQQEVTLIQARSAHLEQEASSLRARCETLQMEKAALLQAQAAQDAANGDECTALTAEVARLKAELDQLVRDHAALHTKLRDQQARANQKSARLAEELTNQERLVENLATNKAEWEKSSQSRYDLLTQQVRKLQGELKQRDAALVQQRLVQRGLEERLANVEHEARLAAQGLAQSLRTAQQEAEILAADSERAGAVQAGAQKAVRLWQIVAVIAILNTLLLLGLLLWR